MKLHLIRAFRDARPYWLWDIAETPDGGCRAEVCRGLTVVGHLHLSVGGDLRLEGFAPRPLPGPVVRALDALVAALPDRRGDVLPTGGGYTQWDRQTSLERMRPRDMWTGERND